MKRFAIRIAAAALAWAVVGVADAAGPKTAPPKASEVRAVAAPDPTAIAPVDSLRRKTMAYELVRFGRNVHVHADEIVHGDVLLIGGELRVDGEIQGGAVVIGGDIHAGPRSRIGGQAVAVAGRVSAAPGARIADAVSLSVLSGPVFARFAAQPGGELLSDLLQLLLAIALAVPLCAWLGGPIERARARLTSAPVKCVGLGVLALPGGAFAIVVVAFLLALTLIGAPIAILLVLTAAAVCVASFVVGAASIGSRVRLWSPRRPRLLLHAIVGLVVLQLPELLADMLGFVAPAGTLRLLHVLDSVLAVAAVAAGLGALLWAQWSGVAEPAQTGR